MAEFFNLNVFAEFAESNTHEAFTYCIQTAERYFRKIKNVEKVNKLQSDQFGFCIFCAGIYSCAKRKAIDDRALKGYVLNRVKEVLEIIHNYKLPLKGTLS